MAKGIFGWTTRIVLLSFGALLAGGCSPYRPADVTVTLDPQMAASSGKTVEVHIVAVNASDYAQWKTEDLSDYWNSADQASLRPTSVGLGLVKVLTFEDADTKTISKDDPIWNDKWSGAVYLLAISNEPTSPASLPGDSDPRRRIFPLDIRCWPGKDNTVQLKLTRSGWITTRTPNNDWQVP